MSLAAAFAEVLLPVLVVAGAGFALGRTFVLDAQSLNRVSLYVFGPALIFVTLARIKVGGPEALRIAAASLLFVLAIGALTWGCGRALRLDRRTLASLLLCTMFMNAGNFGLSTSRFAFGEDGLQRALVFFIPQSITAQLLAIPIAQLGKPTAGNPLRMILRMPQIYAAALGLLVLLSGVQLEARQDALGSLFRGVVLLSEATLPFLLLLLGVQLAQGAAVEQRGLTALATGLRLLAAPPLAYVVGRVLGLSGLALAIVVWEASMPTAVNMILFASEFDARPRFVAGVVVVTTLLSLLTLSGLLALLR